MAISALSSPDKYRIWISDGTSAGTTFVDSLFNSYITYFTIYNGALYFVHLGDLWTTDLTKAGTQKIFDTKIQSEMLLINNKLLFIVDNASIGRELYSYDGNTVSLVKDINTGAGDGFSSSAFRIKAFNGEAYFVATSPATGYELWKSDGTTSGTKVVRDINFGPTNSIPTSYHYKFFVASNLLYFHADDGATGLDLWVTDGTLAGTHLLKDINTPSYDNFMVEFNGKVLFIPRDPISFRSNTIWQTDGTEQGTEILFSGIDQFQESLRFPPVEYLGELYFGFETAIANRELYKLACGCKQNRVVIDSPILDGTYSASNQVSSASTIGGGEQVTFDAKTVLLQPNFTVPAQTVFSILNDGCIN